MTFHTPARVPRRRFYKRLDWKVIASLTAAVLVGTLIFGTLTDKNLREREAAQQEALIERLEARANENDILLAEVVELRKEITDLQRNSARERARLLRQQERMLVLLKKYGVVEPDAGPRDVVIVEARSRRQEASSPSRSGGTGGGGQRQAPKPADAPKAPKPPQSDPTPGPVGPQNPLDDILDGVEGILGG